MKCEHCELNSNSCQAATSRSNSALFVCSILINSSDECGIHSSETVFRFTRFLQPFQTDAIVQFAYSFRVCVVRWLLSYFDQLFIDDGDHCLYSIIFCISFHSSINPHLLIFVEWFIVCVCHLCMASYCVTKHIIVLGQSNRRFFVLLFFTFVCISMQ